MFKWLGRNTHEAWKSDLHNLLTQFSELTQALSNATAYNIDRINFLEKRVIILEEKLNDPSKSYS